jgi:hypothetical protein
MIRTEVEISGNSRAGGGWLPPPATAHILVPLVPGHNTDPDSNRSRKNAIVHEKNKKKTISNLK